MTGVFGGSFNPVHMGHLLMAEYIRSEFRLGKVLFIPAGNPPHKQDEVMASAQHRYNMVQIAIAGNPYFEISDIELTREGITYTADTLAELKSQYPEEKIFFICGADSIVHLPTWHNIGQIFRLADLIVAGRPNVPEEDFRDRIRWFTDQFNAKIHFSGAPMVDISSTAIRNRIRDGLSVRYMVPDAVERYIRQHGLY